MAQWHDSKKYPQTEESIEYSALIIIKFKGQGFNPLPFVAALYINISPG